MRSPERILQCARIHAGSGADITQGERKVSGTMHVFLRYAHRPATGFGKTAHLLGVVVRLRLEKQVNDFRFQLLDCSGRVDRASIFTTEGAAQIPASTDQLTSGCVPHFELRVERQL